MKNLNFPQTVLKNSGEEQPYIKEKLLKSLQHTCLSQEACSLIAEEVTNEITPTTSSNEIFEKTSSILRKKSKLAAAQYSLKRALFDLGPEGHNFETFVARYFEELGYATLECVTVPGMFVTHEIDVIATRPKKKIFVECKFHNRLGIKNDIKIALYVKARWDDVKNGPQGKTLTGYFLASNTAFSKDALIYSKGTGLQLLGVNAPEDNSFLDEIKKLKLYPITSLTKISSTIKRELLTKKIIAAKDLLDQKEFLHQLGCSVEHMDEICEEICFLTKESCENKILGCN